MTEVSFAGASIGSTLTRCSSPRDGLRGVEPAEHKQTGARAAAAAAERAPYVPRELSCVALAAEQAIRSLR
eukprot:CAMPEP_0180051116 /NCGR_PEP_ID=MMETSP0985-20121206/986_1 /TAXON_ID=483367 /ORGANISM="non described non described, Strain CCMP 2436" /LENGTH=70 /DNA_ID=CAMNT_0021980349 /DNA_START=1112 /DNA_END=1321 /DNA_ORIENTATION=-